MEWDFEHAMIIINNEIHFLFLYFLKSLFQRNSSNKAGRDEKNNCSRISCGF